MFPWKPTSDFASKINFPYIESLNVFFKPLKGIDPWRVWFCRLFISLPSLSLARKQAKVGDGCETARRLGRSNARSRGLRATKPQVLRRLIYIYKVVLMIALCKMCTEGFYKLFIFALSKILVFLIVNLILIDISLLVESMHVIWIKSNFT